MSNPKWFKHCWTWIKDKPVGHLVAKKRPMQATEDVIVFSNGHCPYNPIMILLDKPYYGEIETKRSELCGGNQGVQLKKLYTHKYPTTILRFTGVSHSKNVHPTQKPVALFEYLIRTYTNETDTVLDNCAGSGTTGVACINTNRKFILIEKDPAYCVIIRARIAEAWNCRNMLSERRLSGILNQKHQPADGVSATTEEESMSGKNGKKAVAVEELEVDDKMVVAAATDINKVLAPNPLLDLAKPGEDLQKDVEELFPNIIAADKLSAKTWDILKALGWKGVEPEPPKSKKPVKVASMTPLVALATELNEVLAPNPLLDLADEYLEDQVKKLAAQVKVCDPLSDKAWAVLKKLGWKDKDKKVQVQKAAPVHPTTAAAAPRTYTMLKMPVDEPKQLVQIVGCLQKGPLAGDKLLAAMAKVIKTKQPLARILGFYQKKLVASKYVKVS